MFLVIALADKLSIHKKRTNQIREHFLEAIFLATAFHNVQHMLIYTAKSVMIAYFSRH